MGWRCPDGFIFPAQEGAGAPVLRGFRPLQLPPGMFPRCPQHQAQELAAGTQSGGWGKAGPERGVHASQGARPELGGWWAHSWRAQRLAHVSIRTGGARPAKSARVAAVPLLGTPGTLSCPIGESRDDARARQHQLLPDPTLVSTTWSRASRQVSTVTVASRRSCSGFVPTGRKRLPQEK